MTAFLALRALNNLPKSLLLRAVNNPMFNMLSSEIHQAARTMPISKSQTAGSSGSQIPLQAPTSSVPTCPTCKVKLVMRTNRQDLSVFWGCPNFPACRTTSQWKPPDVLSTRDQCTHETNGTRTVRTYGAGRAGRFAVRSQCDRRWQEKNGQWTVADKPTKGDSPLPWPLPSSCSSYTSLDAPTLSAQLNADEGSQMPLRPRSRTAAGKRAFSSESQPTQVESFDLTAEDGEFTRIEDE